MSSATSLFLWAVALVDPLTRQSPEGGPHPEDNLPARGIFSTITGDMGASRHGAGPHSIAYAAGAGRALANGLGLANSRSRCHLVGLPAYALEGRPGSGTRNRPGPFSRGVPRRGKAPRRGPHPEDKSPERTSPEGSTRYPSF